MRYEKQALRAIGIVCCFFLLTLVLAARACESGECCVPRVAVCILDEVRELPRLRVMVTS